MSIRVILEEYKNVTEMLIQAVKSGDIDEEFIKDREKLLNEIKVCDFDKSELKKICDELEILNFEKEAYKILNNEKQKVKEEIITLKKQKQANKSYGNAVGKMNFFNTKV
ncbi:flagellar protein FliT [Clostridium paraputrificum]|uniref:flagellar protein FliT n=1 Tax=Clostridium paraputrificum TaxID=29363 RepID=UPI00374EDF54